MGSFSVWHWLIVLVIVMLVFGTKKIGNMGADLGKAVKGFKDGMQSGENDKVAEQPGASSLAAAKGTIDVEANDKARI